MAKKGAHRSGTAKGRLRERNSRNAARMKQLGIERRTCVCPICYRLVRVPFNGHNCR